MNSFEKFDCLIFVSPSGSDMSSLYDFTSHIQVVIQIEIGSHGEVVLLLLSYRSIFFHGQVMLTHGKGPVYICFYTTIYWGP